MFLSTTYVITAIGTNSSATLSDHIVLSLVDTNKRLKVIWLMVSAVSVPETK